MTTQDQFKIEELSGNGNGAFSKIAITHNGCLTEPLIQIAGLLNREGINVRGERQFGTGRATVVHLEAIPPIPRELLNRMKRIIGNGAATPKPA